jgi:hypothetical protein
MIIPELINKVTQFILNLDVTKFFGKFKFIIAAVTFAAIAFIALGAFIGQLF